MHTNSSFFLKILLFALFFIILFSCENKSKKVLEDDDKKIRFNELNLKFSEAIKGNSDSLYIISQQLMHLADSIGDENFKLQSKIYLGMSYERKGEIDKARKVYSEAYKTYNLANDTNLILTFLNQYGIFFKNFELYDSALVLYEEGEKIATKSNNENLAIMISTNKALLYNEIGNADKAIKTYQKSLDYFDKIKDSFNYAQTCRNIALTSMRAGLKESAIKYFNKSIEINSLLKFEDELASDYMNLGIFYSNTNPDSSLFYYQKAEKIFEKLGNVVDILKIRFNYANILVNKNQLDKARAIYLKILKTCIDQNIPFGIYGCYHQLGILEAKVENFSESLNYFEKAFETAKKYNLTQNLLLSYREALKAMIKSGKTNIITDLFEKYTNLDDSLGNDQTNKNVIKYQTQYESERKENENLQLKSENEKQHLIIKNQKQIKNYLIIISLLSVLLLLILYSRFLIKKKANKILSEKNLLIETQSRQLEQALAQLKIVNTDLEKQRDKVQEQAEKLNIANITKNKIFFIIAHDLKNPFNTILGYSDLLKTDFYKLTDDEKIHFIENIYNSATTAYELLKNLLNWALTQQGKISISKSNILLYKLVEKGINPYLYFAENKQINVELNIDNDIYINTDIDTISTVIGNLVNNSIKFTKNNGTINISCKINEDFIDLIIKDNGIGMPKDKLENLFNVEKSNSSYGTSNEKGSGLGLLLCKEFVELNNGKLKIESEEGYGTTAFVSLPIN